MQPIPDVLKAASNAYRLLMENKRVRVLDIRLRPGEQAPMHEHPNDHVVYVMSNAKLKLTFADGKSGVFNVDAGQTLWMEAGSHATENIGLSEAHNLVVELKK
jgi:beta-alanine degradation protein BauB